MEQRPLDEQLDEVIEDLEEGRLRPTAAVIAWLDHAMADRLGMDVSGLSRQEYEDLRMDLLEVLLAGAIADRLGWTLVEPRS
ncbi:MAG: hypothetical protein HY689_09975 [Chloroflexi bacterium]|nr:hypothetical protein [Chloroflexota bacterium]